MSVLSTLLLSVLGVVVAAQNTHETATHVPPTTKLASDPKSKTPARTQKPSEMLGLYEWMDLLRECGQGDASVSEEDFWARLAAWDEAHTNVPGSSS